MGTSISDKQKEVKQKEVPSIYKEGEAKGVNKSYFWMQALPSKYVKELATKKRVFQRSKVTYTWEPNDI